MNLYMSTILFLSISVFQPPTPHWTGWCRDVCVVYVYAQCKLLLIHVIWELFIFQYSDSNRGLGRIFIGGAKNGSTRQIDLQPFPMGSGALHDMPPSPHIGYHSGATQADFFVLHQMFPPSLNRYCMNFFSKRHIFPGFLWHLLMYYALCLSYVSLVLGTTLSSGHNSLIMFQGHNSKARCRLQRQHFPKGTPTYLMTFQSQQIL